MNPRTHGIVAAATLASCALAMASCPVDSQAAAAWLQETGGADTGMAGAGRAALSLDAASLAGNPASIAALRGATVTTAAMPFELELEFHGDGPTPARARDRSATSTVPALYAARSDGRLAYGFAAYSYLGMSFDLGEHWSGRRVIEGAGLSTLNLAPAIAWSATDRVTVGASAGAQLMRYDATMAVANDAMYYGPPGDLADGQLQLGGSSWAPAGQLGVTYRATDRLQLGASWTAPVSHSATSDVTARRVHPVLGMVLPDDGDVALHVMLPQQLLLGAAWQPSQDTLLAAGATWQDWSALGAATLEMPGGTSTMFPAGLRDTWGASLGVRQSLNDLWSLTAGLGYESSPAPPQGVPAYFPVADQWRLAAGAERVFGDDLRLRLMVSVLRQGDAQVTQAEHPVPLPGIGPLTGRYANARAYMLGFATDFGP